MDILETDVMYVAIYSRVEEIIREASVGAADVDQATVKMMDLIGNLRPSHRAFTGFAAS